MSQIIPHSLYEIYDNIDPELQDLIYILQDVRNYSDREVMNILSDNLSDEIARYCGLDGRAITHWIAVLIPQYIPSLIHSDIILTNWNLADDHGLTPAHYAASAIDLNDQKLVDQLHQSGLDFYTISPEIDLTADDILRDRINKRNRR